MKSKKEFKMEFRRTHKRKENFNEILGSENFKKLKSIAQDKIFGGSLNSYVMSYRERIEPKNTPENDIIVLVKFSGGKINVTFVEYTTCKKLFSQNYYSRKAFRDEFLNKYESLVEMSQRKIKESKENRNKNDFWIKN